MIKNRQLTIELNDQATVQIDITSSKNNETPIILILPAMGVKAKYYAPIVEKLAEADFTIITNDLRGLGTSSLRPSSKVDFGYLDMIEDLNTVVLAIKKEFPNQKIVALGHSLGGQIAALAQAKYPKLLDGLILTAANSVYYKGWSGKQRYMNLFGYTLFPLISRIVGYFPGDKVGFGGKAGKTQLIDWAHVGRNGVYKIIGDDLDYEQALGQIKTPVLAVYIEGDWMSPKAAMAHLYGKFNSTAPITNFTLTRADTGVKLNHFNWVKNGDGIVAAIQEWSSKMMV